MLNIRNPGYSMHVSQIERSSEWLHWNGFSTINDQSLQWASDRERKKKGEGDETANHDIRFVVYNQTMDSF